jgi:diguanylate cyclase
MQQQLRAAKAKLHEQATIIEFQAVEVRTDFLTRLANRRAFDDELARRCSEFERYGTPFSLMLIDLDDFKKTNDEHGHQAGDEVLRGVAAVLRRSRRDSDIVARFGGEEFGVIVPQTTVNDALAHADRLRRAIAGAVFRFGERHLSVTASIGVAQLRPDEEPSVLVRRVDEALYASKNAGKNTVHWHDGQAVHPIRGPRGFVAASEKEKRGDVPFVSRDDCERQCQKPVPARNDVGGPRADESQLQAAQPENVLPARSTQERVSQSGVEDRLGLDPTKPAGGARICDRTTLCVDVRNRLSEWKRGGEVFWLMLLDIDDQLAREQRQRITNATLDTIAFGLRLVVRETDLVARYSPSCFAFVFPGAQFNDVVRIADRLRRVVSQSGSPRGCGPRQLTATLVLAEPSSDDDLIGLLRRAEDAVHRAKNAGRDTAYCCGGQLLEAVPAPADVGP